MLLPQGAQLRKVKGREALGSSGVLLSAQAFDSAAVESSFALLTVQWGGGGVSLPLLTAQRMRNVSELLSELCSYLFPNQPQ